MDRTLTARLPLAALDMALESLSPVTGLVHHSDRGVQYARAEYLRTSRNHGVIPNVSRLGRPYDNGNCERFFRTLKQEEINTKAYKDLEDLRLHIGEFIERYYNRKRLHLGLGYLSPAEFERTTVSSDAASVADMAQLKI